MNTYSREFVCMACALGGLLALLICAGIENLRARRNEKQLVDHLRLARGMLELKKQGRVRAAEDVQ